MTTELGQPLRMNGRMEEILAVVVLYRMRAEESPAFVSLREALAQRDHRCAREADVELMVCDNSPQEQPAPQDFAGPYLRDTANPGLAHWYRVALERAARQGQAWLLLLDQDTTVTGEYLKEVCRTVACVRGDERVVALVPKLVERGMLCSPVEPPMWGAAPAWEAEGLAGRRVIAFNSGAVQRVSALLAMGGYPNGFPQDYLDYATYTVLQNRGGMVYVLSSSLEHELSSNTERADAAAFRRLDAMLSAERRFYVQYGTMRQRCMRRARLLKGAAGRIARGQEGGQTWRMIKWALRP